MKLHHQTKMSWQHKVIFFTLIFAYLNNFGMQKCPGCIQNRSAGGKFSDLYKAVAERNNNTIDAILQCPKHKDGMMEYIASDCSCYTPLLRAWSVGNCNAVEKLVEAGADLSYVTPIGTNIFGPNSFRNDGEFIKMIATIFNSLSTLDQVEAFQNCGLTYAGTMRVSQLRELLNQAKKYINLEKYPLLKREILIKERGQHWMDRFYEIQRKKLEILLKHTKTARLPGDMVRIIVSLVFAEPV